MEDDLQWNVVNMEDMDFEMRYGCDSKYKSINIIFHE